MRRQRKTANREIPAVCVCVVGGNGWASPPTNLPLALANYTAAAKARKTLNSAAATVARNYLRQVVVVI